MTKKKKKEAYREDNKGEDTDGDQEDDLVVLTAVLKFPIWHISVLFESENWLFGMRENLQKEPEDKRK